MTEHICTLAWCGWDCIPAEGAYLRRRWSPDPDQSDDECACDCDEHEAEEDDA